MSRGGMNTWKPISLRREKVFTFPLRKVAEKVSPADHLNLKTLGAPGLGPLGTLRARLVTNDFTSSVILCTERFEAEETAGRVREL